MGCEKEPRDKASDRAGGRPGRDGVPEDTVSGVVTGHLLFQRTAKMGTRDLELDEAYCGCQGADLGRNSYPSLDQSKRKGQEASSTKP